MTKCFDGNKITPLRKEKKMTKTSLAEMLGISQQSMSDIELNRNKGEVNDFVIKGLASIFGVEEDYFFESKDKIKYRYKSNGKNHNKYKQAFRKKNMTITDFLKLCNSKVEVFYDKNIDAHEYLDWKGDAEVLSIETSLERVELKTYRDNELIDTDESTEAIIVLVVKE